MKNIMFVKCIMILFITLCIYTSCYAQKKVKRVDIINYVLSDTLNPRFYLIPINVKYKGSDSIWIGYNDALELYEFCQKKYGWNRDVFINEMRSILLHNRIFEIDEEFLPIKYSIPKSECNCLYNESSTELKKRISDNNYYKYPDNRFTCFVYKCFKNKVPLGRIEGRVVYLAELEDNK